MQPSRDQGKARALAHRTELVLQVERLVPRAGDGRQHERWIPRAVAFRAILWRLKCAEEAEGCVPFVQGSKRKHARML